MKNVVAFALGLLVFVQAVGSYAQVFSGEFVLPSDKGDVTLNLFTDAAGGIGGSLVGTAGERFTIEGIVEEGMAMGVCRGNEGAVFFEAYPEGDQLLFVLMEADAFNMPDYSTATQLVFERRAATASKRPAPAAGNRVGPEQQPAAPARDLRADAEAGDPSWGFLFTPPAGWKWQQDHSGVLLGHDRIAGMILVFRHEKSELQTLADDMRAGLTEEGVYLSLVGQLNGSGDNALSGEYEGVVQGEQAKARGIGTLSPYGGGAYVLAVTTPEKFGSEITGAAAAIVSSMRYVKVDVSDLVRHFSGRWAAYSGNWGGGTLVNYSLFPDGTFSDQSEVSYNTDLTDSHMEATGVSSSQARWTVRGTKQRGVITIHSPGGEESIIEYQVHIEKGQTYWNEYLFDGKHFSKQESY